jgi:small GTP-binding protein
MAVVNQSDESPSAKLVLLGQSTVGKTSIINVAEGGSFSHDQSATIGACFHIKKMKVGTIGIKLHIWDTAGQERFRALAPMYYRGSEFALLVYAVDNRDSFDEVDIWYQKLVEDCIPVPQIVVLANKTDMAEHRQIAIEEGKALAKKLNAKFYEVSAKANPEGIRMVLEEVAIDAVERLEQKRAGDQGKKLTGQEMGLCGC